MQSTTSTIRTIQRIVYKLLDQTHCPEKLFRFNKEYGTSKLNFIPDIPVRKHFNKVATGETLVWGAFLDGDMVGMISGEYGSDYWTQTKSGSDRTFFIHEFVVMPELRGRRIGVNLTALSVDPDIGIFGISPKIDEVFATCAKDNVASRTAFIKGGYDEVLTYVDAARERDTTILKSCRPKVMRVIGVQSGNAVDGIDIGVFDFPPPRRSKAIGSDQRVLIGKLNYKIIANKTFSFTAEKREYMYVSYEFLV